MFFTNIVLLLQLLSPATASPAANTPDQAPAPQHIYTGFSYGAFWSESEPKRYKNFHREFTLAKNLPDVPTPFTSARLYPGYPGRSDVPVESSTSEDAAARRAISVPTSSGSPSHTASIVIPTLSTAASYTASSVSLLPTTTDQTTTLTTVVTTHLHLSLPSTITLRKSTLAPNRTLHLVHKTVTSTFTLFPGSSLSSYSTPSTNTAFPNSSLLSNSKINSLHTTYITLTSTITLPPSYTPPGGSL